MKFCYQCDSEKLCTKHLPDEIKVAGVKFKANLPSTLCEVCGATTVHSKALERFELAIASTLGQRGFREAEVFRFMRKVLGKRAADLAHELGSTPETISRWENGHTEVEPRAFLLLAAMVEDQIRGDNTTERLSQALHKKHKKPKSIELSL